MDENPYRANEADEENGPPPTTRTAFTIRWLQIWLLNNFVLWTTALLWNVLMAPRDPMHSYIMAGVGTVVVTVAAVWHILTY